MITVENISLDFAGNTILDNISIQIKNSDRIGLIGNNGAGKTTFLRILSDTIQPSSGSINMRKNTKIGYLPQEVYITPNVQLKSLVIGKDKKLISLENEISRIALLLENENLSEKKQNLLLKELGELHEKLELSDIHKKEILAEKIMKGLGFHNSDFCRDISEFSGGWRMRAELSRLLVMNPEILLLDEPTNHLDLPSIIWLEKFLKSTNCIIVLVSHDKEFIDRIINRTFEVVRGKIKDFSGNYSKAI